MASMVWADDPWLNVRRDMEERLKVYKDLIVVEAKKAKDAAGPKWCDEEFEKALKRLDVWELYQMKYSVTDTFAIGTAIVLKPQTYAVKQSDRLWDLTTFVSGMRTTKSTNFEGVIQRFDKTLGRPVTRKDCRVVTLW